MKGEVRRAPRLLSVLRPSRGKIDKIELNCDRTVIEKKNRENGQIADAGSQTPTPPSMQSIHVNERRSAPCTTSTLNLYFVLTVSEKF
jgi:hypothetical protein